MPNTATSTRSLRSRGGGLSAPRSSGGDGLSARTSECGLAEVVKIVLGDALKVPCLYDAARPGPDRPVDRPSRPVTTVLAMFEKVRAADEQCRPDRGGGPYRIMSAAKAAAANVTVSLNRDEVWIAGFGVSILPLHNVSAEKRCCGCSRFITRAAQLKAERTGNAADPRHRARAPRNAAWKWRVASTSIGSRAEVGRHLSPHPLPRPEEIIDELTQTIRAEAGEFVTQSIRVSRSTG